MSDATEKALRLPSLLRSGRLFDFLGEGGGHLRFKKSIKQERKQNSYVELMVLYLRRIVMIIFDHVVSQ